MRHKHEVSVDRSNEALRVVMSRSLPITSDADETSAQLGAEIKLQQVVIII
jgi:hypothetical protein